LQDGLGARMRSQVLPEWVEIEFPQVCLTLGPSQLQRGQCAFIIAQGVLNSSQGSAHVRSLSLQFADLDDDFLRLVRPASPGIGSAKKAQQVRLVLGEPERPAQTLASRSDSRGATEQDPDARCCLPSRQRSRLQTGSSPPPAHTTPRPG